jgi:hypothetical protein
MTPQSKLAKKSPVSSHLDVKIDFVLFFLVRFSCLLGVAHRDLQALAANILLRRGLIRLGAISSFGEVNVAIGMRRTVSSSFLISLGAVIVKTPFVS